MQESRLFKIVYHLLDKGRATASELAEKFEVSVRTIYRDIDALSGAGIPIYAEAGRNGGIYLMNDFVMDKAVLTEEEKREILTALHSINSTSNIDNSQILLSLTMIFVGCYLMKAHLALGIALLAFGAAVVFATCFVGVRIEHDTGYYECPVCKKRYVPTMKAVVMALHSGTSRKMKCPYCGNKSYHKKVLTK